MRRFLIVLVGLLSTMPVTAHAQAPGSPQAQEAAQELLAIISGDMLGQMGRAMTAQVWPQLEAELGSKVPPPRRSPSCAVSSKRCSSASWSRA